MALSREDKADVKGAMGKALANKVAKATKDSLHTRMEKKGMRYKAAPMPKNYHSMDHKEKSEYYKHNKGQYVSAKVNPKTGKYFNTD